jgi:hypothetical protein
MKMKRILFGLAVVGALLAQDTAPPPAQIAKPEPARQQRIFQLKYADARDVANVLGVFGYGINANRDLRVVAVSAPAETMAAIEDAVKRLDVPAAAPKDIDLTVYLVVASEQSGASDSLPPELQPVANEMKKIFSYKGFRLLDSILLRTQPGNRAVANGVIRPNGEGKTPYSFTVQPSAVTDDPKGRLIRLDNLKLNMRVPGGDDAGIMTEISVREGQKVVVGKSNLGTPDQALILVVTAKVTE